MVDESSASYRAGSMIGTALMVVGIVALVVWLVTRRRSRTAGAMGGVPSRKGATPDADLATLGRFLTLHAPYELAASVVGRTLAQHPLVTPATGPTPAWAVNGDGLLYLTLVPTDRGAVLRVAEVEVPLRSPQAAGVWGWVLATVAAEATAAHLQMTTGERPLAPARAVGPFSAIWAPAAG